MISRIFIDRPIFAWVLAIVVMLGGVGGLLGLPVAQYPDIAPVQVQIGANYPGASAETVETSVTQIIEQSLQGIDGLLYFSASSTSTGGVGISATFTKGTDPDIAQVQVQNQVQSVIARLPQPVQQRGVTVRKSDPDQLLTVAVYDKTNRMSFRDISDYLSSNIQDPLGRIDGVGNSNVFGSPHAMRIWLDPNRLASFQLMPSDVTNAITAQNNEVAAGTIGDQPAASDQYLDGIGEGPVAPADRRAVQQYHPQDDVGRRDSEAERRRAGRDGLGRLRHQHPRERPQWRRHLHQSRARRRRAHHRRSRQGEGRGDVQAVPGGPHLCLRQ